MPWGARPFSSRSGEGQPAVESRSCAAKLVALKGSRDRHHDAAVRYCKSIPDIVTLVTGNVVSLSGPQMIVENCGSALPAIVRQLLSTAMCGNKVGMLRRNVALIYSLGMCVCVSRRCAVISTTHPPVVTAGMYGSQSYSVCVPGQRISGPKGSCLSRRTVEIPAVGAE